VGEIAAKDMRKAELLKRLGIDFCCGGKKSIEEACLEKGLDVIRVKKELEETDQITAGAQLDFNSFTPSFLADYIVNVHHGFVNKNLPVIYELSQKVAEHHGPSNPFLIEIAGIVDEVQRELTTHMKKEEQILFPMIKLLENGMDVKVGFDSVFEPINVMERDHDIVGDLMKDIRKLTNDYSVPENACNSVKMLYYKLEEFETDLFQHIHLENNILFPKARALEAN
jgi:regulator of cell morphogenesis and NO signaling